MTLRLPTATSYITRYLQVLPTAHAHINTASTAPGVFLYLELGHNVPSVSCDCDAYVEAAT